MNEVKKIICLKWGTKYSYLDVNRLYTMVKKNLNYEFEFYCLTEDANNLSPNIKVLPLPVTNLKGWWLKLSIFQNDFYNLDGTILYLDLDIIIVNSIDAFFSYKKDINFLSILDNSYPQKNYNGFNSSVFRLRLSSLSYVWDIFSVNHLKAVHILHGDQDWLDLLVKGYGHFPKSWVIPFKSKACSSKGKSFGIIGEYLRKKKLFPKPKGVSTIPTNSKIIIFNGNPKPIDVSNSNFLHWKKSPWVLEAWSDRPISDVYYKSSELTNKYNP